MKHHVNYSLLDRPEFHGAIFYPREDRSPAPAGASDHDIPVDNDITVGGRYYPERDAIATILYFHGNGEVAADYDETAPLYHKIRAGLFVADYRGYGRSSGSPSFASMAADGHKVFDYVLDLVQKLPPGQPLFVMGRSLGSHSAIELAVTRSDRMRGLILESGFAHVPRLLRYHGSQVSSPDMDAFERAVDERIKATTLPVLVIHGDSDTLVPPEFARHFYDTVGSKDRTLVTIPNAGHNDIMYVGMEEYFRAVKDFVMRLSS